MQHRVIEPANENHLGIAKTIALLREKIDFANMKAKVKTKISECILCTAVSKSPTLPPYLWHTINIDFLGPLSNLKYLSVAIDQYSRYPVVEIVSLYYLSSIKNIFRTWNPTKNSI